MASLGLREQACEFRLAFERLERGLPLEVREACKTLIDGASEGCERHGRLFHPHRGDRDVDEPFGIPKRRPENSVDEGLKGCVALQRQRRPYELDICGLRR